MIFNEYLKQCEDNNTILCANIELTEETLPSISGQPNISFIHHQLMPTLHGNLSSEDQQHIMQRVRNDILLPENNIATTIVSDNILQTRSLSTPTRETIGNIRNNVEVDVTNSTNREFNIRLIEINNSVNLIPNPLIPYEVGLKQGQLKALRIVQVLLEYRISIGMKHAAGTINDEGILDYSKNMAIVLLHGGPGYGKSHVLQCMRQMNDAHNLSSLVMAFSGTAASQFQGGKTIHGSCGWNVGKI